MSTIWSTLEANVSANSSRKRSDGLDGSAVMSQTALILQLAQSINRGEPNKQTTPDTPVPPGHVFVEGKVKDPDLSLKREFPRVVGTLMYVMVCTRPDIAFVIGQLCRFMHAPEETHWKIAIRVVDYLLTVYTDADWGKDPTSRRSVSGFVAVVNGVAVSWSSRMQRSPEAVAGDLR